MKIISTNLMDLYIIQPNIIEDSRGYFMESFRDDIFIKNFPKINFCQENESKSSYGVLRGLHYQLPPFAQTKLVRVIKGCVLDVALDLRKDSPSFGQHFSIELNEENKKQLLIPRGFAHGFIVLSEEAIFSYKVDNYYSPENDRGIIYNDNLLKIDWVVKDSEIKISEKDINLPVFDKAQYFFNSSKLYE